MFAKNNKTKRIPVVAKLLVVLVFALATTGAKAQQKYTVEEIVKLNIEGHHVKLNAEGNKLLYTTANFNGLKAYDLDNGSDVKISDAPGAGYAPVVMGESIYFKPKESTSVLRTDFEGSTQEVVGEREVKNARRNVNGGIEAKPSEDLRQIVLSFADGSERTIAPLGENDYINVSVSPDQSKLLFRVSGIGSYVTTLDGKVLSKIENAEFPLWLDDEAIVFAKVEDDGYNFTGSELFIQDLTNGRQTLLTKGTEAIGLFPSVASNKIAFSTPDGEVYVVMLSVE